MVKKVKMSRKKAIEFLRINGRNIISTEKAVEVAKVFGLDEVPIHNYTKDNTRGIVWSEGDAVSVYELTITIVKHLGKTPVTSSPFIGKGKEVQYITDENIKFL